MRGNTKAIFCYGGKQIQASLSENMVLCPDKVNCENARFTYHSILQNEVIYTE